MLCPPSCTELTPTVPLSHTATHVLLYPGNGSDSGDSSEGCSEHYMLLDRMQDTFSQLALANTRRTAALCTAPEPLACWWVLLSVVNLMLQVTGCRSSAW